MYKSKIEKPLTDREIEVMKCVQEGLSNAQIAERLCISLATVKAHISSTLLKLDAKNRLDAVLMLVGQKETPNKNIMNF